MPPELEVELLAVVDSINKYLQSSLARVISIQSKDNNTREVTGNVFTLIR